MLYGLCQIVRKMFLGEVSNDDDIILQVVETQEFRDLVLDDADEVRGRQETDSVPIIDDLRFHISSAVQTVSGIMEARTKLSVIEAVLEDLGIEAWG